MGKTTLGVVLGIMSALVLGVGNNASAQVEDARNHNGFYLQVTGGLGYLTTSGGPEGFEQTYSGVTLDTSLMIGGSPIPGLAIGGGLMIDYAPSPSFEAEGTESNVDFSQYLVGIGAFADFYPDPAGGLHFQGFVGWGGLETSVDGNAGGSDPTGLVMSVAGGYDVFISDELSVGGMARLAIAPLSMNDVSFTSFAPALLGTLTYH